jgi:hypothetical protein
VEMPATRGTEQTYSFLHMAPNTRFFGSVFEENNFLIINIVRIIVSFEVFGVVSNSTTMPCKIGFKGTGQRGFYSFFRLY